MALIELINDTKRYHHHFYNIAIRCGFFYRATLNHTEPGREDRARAHADIDSTLAAVAEAMAWEQTN